MEMSEAIKEAYAHAPANITYFDTLEIMHDSFPESIKVVKSNVILETPQGNFSPCNFDFTLPEVDSGVRGQLQITVNFLPKEAQMAIKTAGATREPITIKYRQYLGSNIGPDAELPIPLQVVSIEQAHGSIIATALFPDLHNTVFPRRYMTAKELPGLMA